MAFYMIFGTFMCNRNVISIFSKPITFNYPSMLHTAISLRYGVCIHTQYLNAFKYTVKLLHFTNDMFNNILNQNRKVSTMNCWRIFVHLFTKLRWMYIYPDKLIPNYQYLVLCRFQLWVRVLLLRFTVLLYNTIIWFTCLIIKSLRWKVHSRAYVHSSSNIQKQAFNIFNSLICWLHVYIICTMVARF